MKKIFLLVSVVAAAAAVSCTKESFGIQENNKLTFTASYPQIEEGKTVLAAGNTVAWTATDTISVHNLTASGAKFHNTPKTLSTFSGEAPQQDNYYALSPASALKGWKTTSSSAYPFGVMFIIPDSQIATKGSWDPAAGILYGQASDTDKAFTFSHVTGYLKFTIGASSGSIKSVEVSSSVGMAGQLAITSLSSLQGGKETGNVEYKAITLATADGSAMEPGDYYIALRGRKYTGGLSFLFTNTSNQTATVTLSGDKTVTRGVVYNLGTVSGLEFKSAKEAPAIGTVIGNGIVSYVAPDYYLLMSLTESKEKWTTNESLKSVSISGMTNDDGSTNTASLLKYISDNEGRSIDEFPAVKWATTYGENWYLPSITELQNIFKAASAAGWDTFNAAITGASGTAINNAPASAWYLWSSTQNASDKMSGLKINTDGSTGISALSKYATSTTRNTRAVKKVIL